MNYIDKFVELLKSGSNMESASENIYLNYSSVIDNDEVFKIKKQLSLEFRCDINNVKLIGSSHTGFKLVNNRRKGGFKIIDRNNPEDYDFAIINSRVYVDQFNEIKINDIVDSSNKYNCINNICKGKIHPLYANQDYLENVNKICDKIQKKLNVNRHITVCFYLSEKKFIEGLVSFHKDLHSVLLKEIANQEKIPDEVNCGIKNLDKL